MSELNPGGVRQSTQRSGPMARRMPDLRQQSTPVQTQRGKTNNYGSMSPVLQRISAIATQLYDKEKQKVEARQTSQAQSAGGQYGMNTPIEDIDFSDVGGSVPEQAFQTAAITSARARLDAEISRDLRDMERQTTDVTQFKRLLQQRANGYIAKLDPTLRADALQAFQTYGTQSEEKVYNTQKARELDEAKAAYEMEFGEVRMRALQAAFKGDFRGAKHLAGRINMIMDASQPEAYGGSGALSLEKISTTVTDFTNEVNEVTVTGFLSRMGDNAPAALRSGQAPEQVQQAFDNLPPDKKATILENARTKSVERLVGAATLTIASNPGGYLTGEDPEVAAVLSRLDPEDQVNAIRTGLAMAGQEDAFFQRQERDRKEAMEETKDFFFRQFYLADTPEAQAQAADKLKKLGISRTDAAALDAEIRRRAREGGVVTDAESRALMERAIRAGELDDYDIMTAPDISAEDKRELLTFQSTLSDRQFQLMMKRMEAEYDVVETAFGFSFGSNDQEQAFLDARRAALKWRSENPTANPMDWYNQREAVRAEAGEAERQAMNNVDTLITELTNTQFMISGQDGKPDWATILTKLRETAADPTDDNEGGLSADRAAALMARVQRQVSK